MSDSNSAPTLLWFDTFEAARLAWIEEVLDMYAPAAEVHSRITKFSPSAQLLHHVLRIYKTEFVQERAAQGYLMTRPGNPCYYLVDPNYELRDLYPLYALTLAGVLSEDIEVIS